MGILRANFWENGAFGPIFALCIRIAIITILWPDNYLVPQEYLRFPRVDKTQQAKNPDI